MATYQRKDKYYHKAKEKGLPSRASFKMEEMLQKYPLVKPGDTVLDLGAAPGGWTVILSKAVGPRGRVLAIDLQTLAKGPPPNTCFLRADLQSPEAKQWLEENLGGKKISCVCSDMSPKLTGITFKDRYESYELCLMALNIARERLQLGGALVTKIFPGEEFQDFLKKMRTAFEKVKVFEPDASRKSSREVYVMGMKFKEGVAS